MKIDAKFIKRLYNDQQHSEVSFVIENFLHQRYINDLSTELNYTIEIKEKKQKRSIQQNKYLWAMIRALALKTREEDMDIYIKLLEETNAKYEYVWALEKTEEGLKRAFRAVKKIKPYKVKESDGWLYKCYEGSSKFTVAEMNHLLDALIRWCIEEGVETDESQY